ncbi:hypothetical protein [Flagellimonas allohymeniacidonis]|uniref:Uncharacterized protein n=1 Tax=Flagellimonas allohymeniacidonis TaxID=2517819 RepID=A0A4Q8QEE4_9FLAO|nr:hypothetical protein [Allomuricauda hymeniacidonis]TAI48811.1 hypothetical protein EW142_03160 [Allomuricauda hymeniacidonis]
MRHKRTYLLMAIVSMLLLGLLANQIVYVYTAAIEQEAHFNEKASLALESIVNNVSEDYQVCQSVNDYCLGNDSNSSCKATFESKDEWQSVDSIIRTELLASNIDLKYRFDFCKSSISNDHPINTKNTFTTDLKGPVPSSAGILMHLEFPSKSNYIMRQMGLPFLSSVMMILLISIGFVVTFQYYRKEKENAAKTTECFIWV